VPIKFPGCKEVFGKNNILSYTKLKNGSIPLTDKWKIICFIKRKSWDFIVSSPIVSPIITVWGRDVIIINFEDGRIMDIAEMKLREFFTFPLSYMLFILKALFFLPQKDLHWIKSTEKKMERRFSPRFIGPFYG